VYVSRAVTDFFARLRDALAARYRLERELGRGGMAFVFQARDPKHERWVAIKVLRPELAQALGPERFLREIKVAAGLTHPNILPLYDSGEAGGFLYYVMPYVEGESLRHRLVARTRLPVEEAVAIAREVADALHFANQRGVVHRDIKPENILFQSGHALVSDFGIARAVSAAGGTRVTAVGIAVGTPEYMSPEQAAGEDDVDGRSDVYSLGCVLFEMLTGQPPFGGTTPQKVLARQRGDAAPGLGDLGPVPETVAQAVGRALEKHRGARFATAGDFAAALGGAPARPAAGAWLRRRLAAAAFVGVVAGAATFGWWWTHRRPAHATPAVTRVAVLYFEDLSGTGKLRPVAAGLTEDLIDQLWQVRALQVISPEGVRPYRDASVAPDSIARALGVGTLVAGSVARSGDELRVSVRLIDGSDGRQLNSETVERAWGDLFALRDQLSVEVAQFLRERLGQEVRLRQRRTGTKSVAAWTTVRDGDEMENEARVIARGGDSTRGRLLLDRADSLYARAETLDPRWVVPIEARARLALYRAIHELRASAIWVRRGLEHSERALALQPGVPEALAVRGRLRYYVWRHTPGSHPDSLRAAAETDLTAAVAGDSALAPAWYTLAELYRYSGRFSQAEQAAREALAADAFLSDAYVVTSGLFFTALNLERYDDAREWCGKGARQFPRSSAFVSCAFRIVAWSGQGRAATADAWRLAAVVDRVDTDPEMLGDRHLLVAAVLARSGLGDSARAVIGRTRATIANPAAQATLDYDEAYVRLLLGERDTALRLLGKYLRTRPENRAYVAQSAWFRALHDDPRFQALVRPAP
jgi:TolB-like protein/tetratricopeptide (TPR) repeat protein/tRNA A-37 threonylcarbamoyl transferase component Bud32